MDGSGLNVTYHQANKLYLNDGAGKFVNVSRQAGPALQQQRSSRGAAFADFNNDGRIDIALLELDDLPSLLINRFSGNHHWIGLELKGKRGNGSGVGARVSLRVGGRAQIREVKAGASFASCNDPRVHFGLGSATQVEELIVRWPSGRITRREALPVDRYLEIWEPDEAADSRP